MGSAVKLDSLDQRILALLQEDATLSAQEIGQRVGLSATPCWRRIKNLEAAGVIERRVAIVNPSAIGLGGTVFVFIRTSVHDADWLQSFARAVEELPEVIDCHRLAGTIDYLLKCVVRDIDHYDEVYKRLIQRVPGLVDISASFSMERLKQVTKIDCGTAG